MLHLDWRFFPVFDAIDPASAYGGGYTDTGIGMRPDQIPIAFSPFGQLESGLNRRYDGAGIGLPLTKRLVELHGGTIAISSELGRGTEVRVHLPPGRRNPA